MLRVRRVAAAMVMCGLFLCSTQASGAAPPPPKAVGGLDCNGFSPIQQPIKRNVICPEPTGSNGERFEDNGHYVGHDEPSLLFYSDQPGSGNSAKWNMTLPTDPAQKPNGSFNGPVWSFQEDIAGWFGMVMCDNESWPEGTKQCTPDSDTNIQVPPRADHAGTAYMELQFYPPGYPPFTHSISCDKTQWCVALTMTSLQYSFDFSQHSGNCAEPQAFAFLTLSGAPGGPTGPDNQTSATYTPNADTFKMNSGDGVQVTLHDTAAGFEAKVTDVTSGSTGRMVAGAGNGWRHILWDPVNHTCQGAPYTFHPMYDTAAPPVGPDHQPTAWAGWTAHNYNIAFSAEIGHFENRDGDSDDPPCHFGPMIEGCTGSDLDFDGFSYYPDWPDGSSNFPSAKYLSSPTSLDSTGHYTLPYSSVAFEVDLPAVEGYCSVLTGKRCNYPPNGPGRFYPWFHTAAVPAGAGTVCRWALSNDLPNQIDNFGGMRKAWGDLEKTNAGTPPDLILNFYNGPLPNPC